MSEKNPIRVFVTHVFDESDDYLRVFEFLESDDRFYYLNTAKPENMPSGGMEEIKDELIGQIKASEAVLVLASTYLQNADLVSYMMDVAEANSIGMAAIKPFGGLNEMPQPLIDRVGEGLEWNARTFIDSIKLTARGEDTQRWEVIDFPGFDADGEIEE
ncbi:MAG: hypothetical protein AAF351_07000 [Pseudomonadota bacterium]